LQNTFQRVARHSGTTPRTAAMPARLHDLRINTILDAYSDGDDPGAKTAILTTYLGHFNPAHTYWYLSASSELMKLAGDRSQRPPRRWRVGEAQSHLPSTFAVNGAFPFGGVLVQTENLFAFAGIRVWTSQVFAILSLETIASLIVHFLSTPFGLVTSTSPMFFCLSKVPSNLTVSPFTTG
jgi:hypothetical protein